MSTSFTEVVSSAWQAVSTVDEPAPTMVVVGTAIVALVLVTVRPLWLKTRHVITQAHEGSPLYSMHLECQQFH